MYVAKSTLYQPCGNAHPGPLKFRTFVPLAGQWDTVDQIGTVPPNSGRLTGMQSVCHFLILEKATFSGLKLTSVHSR